MVKSELVRFDTTDCSPCRVLQQHTLGWTKDTNENVLRENNQTHIGVWIYKVHWKGYRLDVMKFSEGNTCQLHNK